MEPSFIEGGSRISEFSVRKMLLRFRIGPDRIVEIRDGLRIGVQAP